VEEAARRRRVKCRRRLGGGRERGGGESGNDELAFIDRSAPLARANRNTDDLDLRKSVPSHKLVVC
jgi:hypothetical protein